MKKHIIFLIIVLIVITSCTASEETTNITPVTLEKLTETIDTITPQESTMIARKFVDGNIPQDTGKEGKYSEDCIPITEEKTEQTERNGVVYLKPNLMIGKGFSGVNSKYELSTHNLSALNVTEEYKEAYYDVSPDGKFLAFFIGGKRTTENNKNGQITITDSNGKSINTIKGSVDWRTGYWLSNDLIAIGTGSYPTVINPFTGEVKPGYDWYLESPGGILTTIRLWEQSGFFNSSANQIFYIQQDGSLILWDLKQKKEIIRIPTLLPQAKPQWSPDYSKIAFAYSGIDNNDFHDEIYVSDMNGEVIQITNLDQYFSKTVIYDMAWSKDGEKIAFIFRDLSVVRPLDQLGIVNIPTKDISNYCNITGAITNKDNLIWSPTHDELLIGRLDAESDTYSTVLLNIENCTASTLVKDLLPVDWVVSP